MKIIKIILLVLVLIFLFTGCGEDVVEPIEEPQEESAEDLSYTYQTITMDQIEDGEILSWYQEHNKEFGTYKYRFDGENIEYLLIGAGERRTGGYSLEIENVEINDGKIVFDIILNEPGKDEMVTQALTYPSLLIKIETNKEAEIISNLKFEESEDISKEEDQLESEVLKYESVSGQYVGQIDNNFIEMDISNNQDFKEEANIPNDFFSLMLSQQAKEQLKDIEDGSNVIFDCYKNEDGTWILQGFILGETK